MTRKMKILILFFLPVCFLAFSVPVSASDEIKVEAELDNPSIFIGDEVTYTVMVEGANIPEGIRPTVKGLQQEDVDLLGLNTSRSMISGSSFTIVINNQVVRDEKNAKEIVSFEYHLRATKSGSYSIGPAVIRIDNADYSSQPVMLKVSELPTAAKIETATADVFVHAEPGAGKLWVGQLFAVSYYFYFRNDIDIQQLTNSELPELNGFIRYDFEKPHTRSRPTRVTFEDGQQYYRVYICRLIAFPTRAGSLKIEPFKQKYTRAFALDRNLLFPQRNAEKIATSQPVEVEVTALPVQNRPRYFSGAVGSFNLNAGVDRASARAGESVTMTVVITGAGNIEGAADPIIKLPLSVESYPPEKEDRVSMMQNDLQWERVYRYILVPREAGRVVIGPIRFTFFRPDAGVYQQSVIKTLELNVMPGLKETRAPDDAQQETSKIVTDIRYIKPDTQSLRSGAPIIYRRGWFIALHLTPLFLLGAALMWRRHRDRLETDIAYARRLKSRDRANRRIEKARKAMGASQDDFHRELYMAVTGYMADHFDLPDVGMPPGEFAPYLDSGGASDEAIERVVKFLEKCQSVRYLPESGETDEKSLLSEAGEIIKSFRRILKESPSR